ncbi:MAG: YraN family protein [Cyanobacteriota bacterium]|nr:YraN family protein [Cyanobacteriota bacterium]
MNSSGRDETLKIGKLGEKVVEFWLEGQGWTILHRRWRCRWGEIDLVARCNGEAMLAFVEVKTRSRDSWDEGGLLAITPRKQAKLWQAAEMFLAEFPELAVLPCRFDLALVGAARSRSDRETTSRAEFPESSSSVILGQPIILSGYRLVLHRYLEAISLGAGS